MIVSFARRPDFSALKEESKRRFSLQARLAKNRKNFGQHLSRDYCPPGHENPAMGFFWGVDQDAIVDLLKKLFFDKVRPPKPGKSSLSVLVHDRNRSGVVDLVGREPLMFAKVEKGVTKSCQKFRRKNRKNAILA